MFYYKVITAHWLTQDITISSVKKNSLLFDYNGFPPESYQFSYDAPGSPDLTKTIKVHLTNSGISCMVDETRGLDHGVFVPLLLMYPSADIPVVAMSLQKNLDPSYHIKVGQALRPLREQDVLILGSGASFHNFDYFFSSNPDIRADGIKHGQKWDDYLVETLTSPSDRLSQEEKINRLVHWFDGPSATEAHKLGKEEHLIPLHVIAGAGAGGICKRIGPENSRDEIASSGFEWS